MIRVSDAFKEAWLNGNQKEILLNFSDGSTLTNDDVVSESFSLVQSVCEEEQITFGLTSSAQVSVQIYNTGKQYKGLTMSVTLIAGEYPMQIGVFKIDDDVRSDDRSYRTLTGYDTLKDVLNNDYSAWHNALSSMTLKQYRDAFFNHIGITQETTQLLDDSLRINIKNVQSLSGAEIIRFICEPNACFGFINNLGNFQYTEPIGLGKHYPADDLYPANDLYPGDGIDVEMTTQDDELAPIMGGVVCSDYSTHKITQVRFNYSENTPEVTYGVPGNRYELTSNVLMYGQSENALLGVLQNFMNNVEGFFYTPGRLSGRARVWAQLGDIVGAAIKDMSVAFPILRRSMKGITALYDEYEARGREYYTYSANTYERRIADAETASYEQAGQIDDINEDIEDINENVGNLEIHLNKTDEGLLAEVTRAEGEEARIELKVDEFRSEIAGSQKEWDTSGYNVTEFGYDSPAAEGYEPSEYTGEYYLNQTNGYLYRSNGSSWTLIKYCRSIQVALQSQITQTATSINLAVSKKVDKNGEGDNTVVSQINLSRETITLSTGRLVINSGNFQVDSSGYMTCYGANINGNVNIPEGSKFMMEDDTIMEPISIGYGVGVNCFGQWQFGGDVLINGKAPLLKGDSVSKATNAYYLKHNSSNSSYVTISSKDNLIPSDSQVECGTSSNPFKSGYATGNWTSSDKKEKTHIRYLEDDDRIESFVMGLKPAEYGRKDDSLETCHFGFYAQDVYENAKKFDTRTDFMNVFFKDTEDTVCQNPDMYKDEHLRWWLNYPALIAPLVSMVQKQHNKIEELENRIKILEEER